MLDSAHKGYEYQDLLSAYFVAKSIADNKLNVEFLFDVKDFDGDKFDDLKIYDNGNIFYRQIKHSANHCIEKNDFSSPSAHDLYLKDLFDSWKLQVSPNAEFRLCLVWDKPEFKDDLNKVLVKDSSSCSLFPGSECFKIDCSVLWPVNDAVISNWRKLKEDSAQIKRAEFKKFLDELIVEICYPSLEQLECLFRLMVDKIGIGDFPNGHLTIDSVCDKIQSIIQKYRADGNRQRVSAKTVAEKCGIKLNCGGIDENFPIDERILVEIPDRIKCIENAFCKNNKVIATAEPGAGKSWLISSLEKYISKRNVKVVKHYCYVDLSDSLFKKRIETNTFYGSILDQLYDYFPEIERERTFAATAKNLNAFLSKVNVETLLIIDGIDHVKRIYDNESYAIAKADVDVVSAIKNIDVQNEKIKILVVSQPLDELEKIKDFSHIEIPPITADFVRSLLYKNSIDDKRYPTGLLSDLIVQKSQGNVLYCKYLLDYAKNNVNEENSDWLVNLPPYDYNLKSYYKYILEKISGDFSVTAALCGVDCSLTEAEIRKITGSGKIAVEELEALKPLLRFKNSYGYSIYHESFKRHVYELLYENEIDINKKVYKPLIEWLENEDFFENKKAYAYLLKFYYEVGLFEKILQRVSISFLDESLINVCSIEDLQRNHEYQKKSLKYSSDLKTHIIVAEQSKMISQIDYMGANDFFDYLEAVKYNVSPSAAYDFIQREGSSKFDFDSTSNYLMEESFKSNETVHWELCQFGNQFELKYIDRVVVKLLSLREYEKLDEMVLHVHNKYIEYIDLVLFTIEKWIVSHDSTWLNQALNIKKLLESYCQKKCPLKTAVDDLLAFKQNFNEKEELTVLRNLEVAAKNAAEEDVLHEKIRLGNSNWYNNWILFEIDILRIDLNCDSNDKIIQAFSNLVRNDGLSKNGFRLIDVHFLFYYFDFSFRRALSFCANDQSVISRCLDILDSSNGPFKKEYYLPDYAPELYPVSDFEKSIKEAEQKDYYQDLANLYFKYSVLLSKRSEKEFAEEYYKKGVVAFWGYGSRKDASIYELFNCIVPYANYTANIDDKKLIQCYEMSFAVKTHTDGSGTWSCPIDFFELALDISSDFALNCLIIESLTSKGAAGCFDEFLKIYLCHGKIHQSLEKWFFLCKTLPLLNSEKILSLGLKNIDSIDSKLKLSYKNWLEQIPFVAKTIDDDSNIRYSEEIDELYKKNFCCGLPRKLTEKEKKDDYSFTKDVVPFSAQNLKDAASFLEKQPLKKTDIAQFINLYNGLDPLSQRKLLILYAESYYAYQDSVIDDVLKCINNEEMLLLLNVYYYVNSFRIFHKIDDYLKFIKNAYAIDNLKCLNTFYEALGGYIENSVWPHLTSCNIIRTLIELKIDQNEISRLFNILFTITDNKLPECTRNRTIEDVFDKVNFIEWSSEEKLTIVLISRLNRLGIEKSQHSVYALTYIAEYHPLEYIKALSFIFSNDFELLPLHRAFLLQLVDEKVPQEYVSDCFKALMQKIYPSNYFYENYLLKKWVDCPLILPDYISCLSYASSSDDEKFLPSLNLKYACLWNAPINFSGTVNAFEHKKSKILLSYEDSFVIRPYAIQAPNVAISNAIYEVANEYLYTELERIKKNFGICLVSPFLNAYVVRCIGSHSKRPSYIPQERNANNVQNFPPKTTFYDDEWIVLAYYEEEIVGDSFDYKKNATCDYCIYSEEGKSNRCVFCLDDYQKSQISGTLDKWLSTFSIYDSFERMEIRFLSPTVMAQMGLRLNDNPYDGLMAVDDNLNVVAKMLTWDEDYYGRIGDGVEKPRLKGTALLFRKDKMNELNKCIYAFTK